MTVRWRATSAAVAAMALGAGISVAAPGSAGPALAEGIDPADPTAPAAPCPGGPGPVGPPGVTDVPSALGALMSMWQQARTPSAGQFAGPGAPWSGPSAAG